MYSKGQVVYSKCGRDKGRPFIIVDFDEEFVYLADGSLRKLEKPKKKKQKHIQVSKEVCYDIKKKLDESLYLLDADIRKALEAHKK